MNLSYTGWVALFGLAGLGWVLRRGCRSLADVADALARVFLVGLAALVCGRIGYALLNIDFFAQKPAAIFAASYPGLAEQTALLGAWLAWLALSPIPSLSRRQGDARAFILLAALIGMGASVGCMKAGCAYGREVFWQDGANSIGWLLRTDLPDAYSIANPRWPTQAMMMVWLAVLLVPCFSARLRASAVKLFVPAFLIGDFFIQFLRADPAGRIMFGLRGSQGLDVAVVGLVLLAYFVTMRLARKR